MPTPQLLTQTLLEGTTGLYDFTLVDETGAGVDGSELETLTLTLFDLDSDLILNGRAQQNILNANGGTVTTTTGLTPVTTVSLALAPADTVMLNHNRLVEYRVLVFEWTWASGTKHNAHVIQFGVENIPHGDGASPLVAGGAAKYVTTFRNLSTLVIPGTQHGLATADLVVAVYDNATPRTLVPVLTTIDATTFDIVIAMLTPMSGRVVVFG
jgi:hypothetical protein